MPIAPSSFSHRRLPRWQPLALLLTLGVQFASPWVANAQRVPRPVGAAPRMQRSSTAAADAIVLTTPGGRGARVDRVAEHVVIGALAGAAAGAAVAFVLTHDPKITDHSEDGIAYIVFMPGGAAVGGLVGLVVGLVRTR